MQDICLDTHLTSEPFLEFENRHQLLMMEGIHVNNLETIVKT